MKRWRARARGRVARIRKRTCHITIKVAQSPRLEAATRQPAPPPASARPRSRKRAPRRSSAGPAAKKRPQKKEGRA